MKARLLKAVVVIFTIIFVAVLAFNTFYGGFFATPSHIYLKPELDSFACEGEVELFTELKDAKRNRIPGTLIHLYADNELIDSLYTDNNGQIRTHLDLKPQWCGQVIEFKAIYDGDSWHQQKTMIYGLRVRKLTRLELNITSQPIVDEDFEIVARLSDQISREPLVGKTIKLDSFSAVTDINGSTRFRINLNKTGRSELSTIFEGDLSYEHSQSTITIEISPKTCDDGTPVNECSGQYLCTENQTFVFSCDVCPCPSGLLCIENQCISEEKRIEQVIENLQRSSLHIESDAGIGSGVIIDSSEEKTAILTNRHVIDEDFIFQAERNIEIFNYEREIGKPARIMVAPNQIDLAIIIVNKKMGPPAMINNASFNRGSEILAMGSPLGVQNTVTKGIVSNFFETDTKSGYGYEAIQMDAAVNPGNSGGGIFLGSSGELIGITTFKLLITEGEPAEGLGFAIPLTLLEEFPIKEWRAIPP